MASAAITVLFFECLHFHAYIKKKKNIFKLLKGIRKKLKDTGAADSAFDSTCSCKNPSSVPTSSDS